MAKTATRSVELEPIDRLEEKLKLLVGMVERMKAEQARAIEGNQRLGRELESLKARLVSTESIATEVSALKEERDVIRTRVADMLDQLEALNLYGRPTVRSSRSRFTDSAIRFGARSIRTTSTAWRATSTRRCAPPPTRPRPATRCGSPCSPRSTSPTSCFAAA